MRRAPVLILVLLCGAPAAVDAAEQDPVSSQEIEKLKRQIYQESRSNLELIFDAHGENGGPNDELGFWRYGGKLNLRSRPGSSVYVTALRTRYASGGDTLQAWGTRVAGGYRGKPFGEREVHLELGVTRFEGEATTVDGLASWSTKPREPARVRVTASRTNVEESFLSTVGMRPVEGPFAGQRVGNVMENRLAVGGDYRLPHRLDAYAELSAGTRSGSNVDSNPFWRAGGGIGWSALARAEDRPLSLVRLSVSADAFGFGDDRLGYGGASLLDRLGRRVALERLGSDGISPEPTGANRGVGGYFSPARFLSAVGRIDVKGRSGKRLDYRLSAFLGGQGYTGVDARRAAGVTGNLVLHVGNRLSIPVTALWDDYGPFRQQSLFVRLLVRF